MVSCLLLCILKRYQYVVLSHMYTFFAARHITQWMMFQPVLVPTGYHKQSSITLSRPCMNFIIIYSSLYLLVWLVPLPAVLMASTIPEYKYSLAYFPPMLCITRNVNLWFFSTMLVMDVLGIVHMSMLILVFWIVHKVSMCAILSSYFTVHSRNCTRDGYWTL